MLDEVERIDSIGDLLGALGALQRSGVAGVYQPFVDVDPGDPDRYLVFFEQGGLSLPDESYYREEHFAGVREALVAHVRRMFELAGLDQGAQRAQRVFDLETELAACHWDNVANREREKTYNLLDWNATAELFASGLSSSDALERPGLQQWLDGFDAPAHSFDEVVVRQPSFVSGVAALVDEAHLQAWKDWTAWQVIRSHAPYLSSDFVNENFDFYGRTLTGAPELRERWKRGVSLVEDVLGEAVGKALRRASFPARGEVRHGRIGGEPRRGVPAQHQRPRVDEPANA